MDQKIADDLLWGVPAIAEEIGLPVQKVYYKLNKGHLPAAKVGRIWVASRKSLQKFFQEQMAGAWNERSLGLGRQENAVDR